MENIPEFMRPTFGAPFQGEKKKLDNKNSLIKFDEVEYHYFNSDSLQAFLQNKIYVLRIQVSLGRRFSIANKTAILIELGSLEYLWNVMIKLYQIEDPELQVPPFLTYGFLSVLHSSYNTSADALIDQDYMYSPNTQILGRVYFDSDEVGFQKVLTEQGVSGEVNSDFDQVETLEFQLVMFTVPNSRLLGDNIFDITWYPSQIEAYTAPLFKTIEEIQPECMNIWKGESHVINPSFEFHKSSLFSNGLDFKFDFEVTMVPKTTFTIQFKDIFACKNQLFNTANLFVLRSSILASGVILRQSYDFDEGVVTLELENLASKNVHLQNRFVQLVLPSAFLTHFNRVTLDYYLNQVFKVPLPFNIEAFKRLETFYTCFMGVSTKIKALYRKDKNSGRPVGQNLESKMQALLSSRPL